MFEACLPYETTVVELAGRVERETFPGRPDYESTEKGDEPETYWVLHFSRPVCVREMRPLYHASSTNVTRMQLMLSPGQYDTYGALVGQRVVASGTLMRWITGHHHTPVLLQVQGLRAATAADTLP
ncbi:MAG TPA: DUF4431 domain-containing protein [Longimicrobium sp.]|nr:DUF4431 domain-containing protein [Longimicrobium sp.]